jgi:hypothetical protein
MTRDEFNKGYASLLQVYNSGPLPDHGVYMPGMETGGRPTKDALVLVYLYLNFGLPVLKKDLTTVVREFYPETADVQQGRHLGRQKGWHIISGTSSRNARGSYILSSLDMPHPGFSSSRRNIDLAGSTWEEVKIRYRNMCATCGAVEGEPHRHDSLTLTFLEKSHMDPTRPLDGDNTIPQCQLCNKAYRDRFCFDSNGRVTRLSDPSFILSHSPEFISKLYELIRDHMNK